MPPKKKPKRKTQPKKAPSPGPQDPAFLANQMLK